MRVLHRASFGYLWRHPWQLALALLGICIGVAVMVAVDLANQSSRKAFMMSMDAINGQATQQIVGGPGGLDERLYTTLRTEHGIRGIAPLVDGYIQYEGKPVQLLGVDLFAEREFRSYAFGARTMKAASAQAGQLPGATSETMQSVVRKLLTVPGALLLPAATAAAYGLKPDDALHIEAAGRPVTAVVAGVLADDQQGPGNIVVADIAVAQEWLQQVGRLSRIDVRIPAGDPGRMAAKISAVLPPGAQLLDAAGRTRSVTEMSNAFMTNLTAMSLLALLVGVFLIYNSVSFAVLQRRGLIGVLRALGLTQNGAFALIMIEAAALGIAGAVLGVALGIWLGEHLLALVSRSINDLYFRVNVTAVAVTGWSVARGMLAGFGATLIAAAVPALEAAAFRPQLALTRSVLEHRSSVLAPRIAGAGIAAIVLAIALLTVSGTGLVAGLGALFLLILGFAVCIPVAVKKVTAWLAPHAGAAGGMPARMAVSGVGASLSRTGVAVVALAVAVSTTIGVTVMVDSFRSSVSEWLGYSLQSEIYIGVPNGSLDATLIDDLAEVPGIANYSARRRAWIESPGGRTRVIAVKTVPGSAAGFRILDADADLAWQQFEQEGALLVSEPFGYRNGLGSGDTFSLVTQSGERQFFVAATYQSYDAGSASLLMSRDTYLNHWADSKIDSLGIYLEPGADPETVMRALERTSSGRQSVLVRSNRDLRDISLQIFDRTFIITNVLYWLAVAVAIIGILGAMLALQMERARELATLRALGMTPLQLGGMMTLQSGYIGLLSGLAAMPLGVLMARVLIDVINRRSFGWQMDIEIAPAVLLSALALSVGAALIAGIYPAYRAASAQPALAMREE